MRQNERGVGREKDTQGRTKDSRGREGETKKKVRESERDSERKSDSERERKSEGMRESEKEKKMLDTYYATKCTRLCMECNITPKASPRLAFTLSNHTSHSIKQGHPQHTIKPHFHPVSVSIVIFHTLHRATGSSSLVVYIYTKQYRISV